MPRPSLATQRVEQIVEATIRAIAAHGITGASLERIADEAGMSRGHVRHFVGNRDELLRLTARRFFFDGDGESAVLPAHTSTVAAALDHLFGAALTTPGRDNAVVLGLVEAARTDAGVAATLEAAYRSSHARLAELLRAERPTVSPDAARAAAYAVVAIALHNVFLGDISSSAAGTPEARAAAERVLATLS